MLVGFGGEIRLLLRDECTGDHAEIENLVDAICHVCSLEKVDKDYMQRFQQKGSDVLLYERRVFHRFRKDGCELLNNPFKAEWKYTCRIAKRS